MTTVVAVESKQVEQLATNSSAGTIFNRSVDGNGNPSKLAFFGEDPVVQYSPPTPAVVSATTGDIGTSAYTIGDLVRAMKLLGLLKK